MNKKSKIYISIFIVFITVMIASASYAYLVRGRGVGEVLNSNVATTNQKPVYSAYSEGNIEFNITATQMSQLNVTTNAVAVDNANIYVDLTSSTDSEGTRCMYDLVWVWDSKDKYTTADVSLPYTAENGIVYPYELSIKINDGEEKDLSSYIWDEKGSTKLLGNEVIESSSATEKTQRQYNIEVKAYNINAAQRNLFDKNFGAHIEVQNYNCYTSNDIEFAGADSNLSVPSTSLASAEDTITTPYTYQGNGEVTCLSQNSSVATCSIDQINKNLTINKVGIGLSVITLKSSATSKSNAATLKINTRFYTPNTETTFNSYIIGLNGTNQGDGQVVNENGYRYEGTNPNNYVWFNDEEWRVIGVFDAATHGISGVNLVKLIKSDRIGNVNIPWDLKANDSGGGTYYNNWNDASLKNILNNEYYNNQTITYYTGTGCTNNACTSVTEKSLTNVGIKDDITRNMIQDINWKIGGQNSVSVPAATFYNAERGGTIPSGAVAITSTALPIGLMYPSDYGYAVLASDCARNINFYNYHDTPSCYQNNWLYKGRYAQWSITPYSGGNLTSYGIFSNGWTWNSNGADANGSVGTSSAYSISYSIRPTLYLKASIKTIGGNGTKNDPFILSNN